MNSDSAKLNKLCNVYAAKYHRYDLIISIICRMMQTA